MNILLFGASGMVEQGALGACLADPRVERVAIVVCQPTGRGHPKLDEIVLPDLFAIETIADRLGGFGARPFCVGVTSFGLSEAACTRLTYDMTLAVATCLARLRPPMTFIDMTGAGTDAAGTGRLMWARVKGRTENALRALPFKAACMLRPGLIQPQDGIRSKTGWCQAVSARGAPHAAAAAPVSPAASRPRARSAAPWSRSRSRAMPGRCWRPRTSTPSAERRPWESSSAGQERRCGGRGSWRRLRGREGRGKP